MVSLFIVLSTSVGTAAMVATPMAISPAASPLVLRNLEVGRRPVHFPVEAVPALQEAAARTQLPVQQMVAASLRWAMKHSGTPDDVLLAMVAPGAFWLLHKWRRNTFGDVDTLRRVLDDAREQLLQPGGLPPALIRSGATVSVRAKGLWSTFHKATVRGQEVHDVLALRIVVPGGDEACFKALESIRTLWPSIPDRFKDYVSRPKVNGYAALHDTVVLPGGHTVEVQIRSEAMHRHAEFGSAAHRRYKGMTFELPGTMLTGVAASLEPLPTPAWLTAPTWVQAVA